MTPTYLSVESLLSQLTDEADFSHARRCITNFSRLFSWSEAQFLKSLKISAIRRIGHLRWLRNVAVARAGNAPW